MANFDASGCPSDFLALIRRLQADIDDKKNLIAREKQLIEDVEQRITEKVKATKETEAKNAELESSIDHLRALHRKQMEDNKRLDETRELLKEQAKTKAEMFNILKEKSWRIKDKCEKMFDNYMMKFVERMGYYEQLPLVPEYKEQMSQIIELNKTLDQKLQEQKSLQDEVEVCKSKKDAMKPDRTITQWGVELAKLYQNAKRKDIQLVRQSNSELEKEITDMRLKKKSIQAGQSKVRRATMEVDRFNIHNTSPTPDNSSKLNEMLPTISKTKPVTSKQYSVPDFRSFFKNRPTNDHRLGTSGSSVASARRYSLPNISSLMPALQPKKPSACLPSNATSALQPIDDGNEKDNTKLKPSLSSLLPQVQKPGIFKTRRSLNPPTTPNLENTEQKSNSEKVAPTNEVRSKDSRSSWPFPAGHTHTRVTEVPLLRQVQEKMLQKKIVHDEDEPVAVVEEKKNDNETSTQMQVDETSSNEPEKPSNLLTVFDGPSYEVPMQTEEEQRNEPDATLQEFASPKRFSMEEHQQMMAELQKSPEDFFNYQANIMSMEGGDASFLISPLSDPAKSPPNAQSPESVARNEFQFAVPTEPAPGHTKRTWGLGDFSPMQKGHTFKETSSPTKFQGFNFGDTGEDSQKTPQDTQPSPGFSFGTGAAQDTSDAESSSFSFAFGGKNVTSPPDNSENMFSFGAARRQSPEKGPVNFFGASTSDKEEESSSSSFASLFGF